jgi:sugar O-acyltransferase (sialic acid O-acetyltransferase NeuD family)
MRTIVLWGASGHARVLAEFLGALDFAVVALVDNDPTLTSFLPGVPLLRGEAALREWRSTHPGETHALVAVGGSRGAERLALQRALADAGYVIPSAVHPRAFVAADATIGPGSQVLALAAVAAAARIGAGCIVNTSASVDHECRLDDGVHVGPGATLAGNVTVGRNAFIGTGCAIIPNVTIGAGAIVGAGSVVVRDVPANTIAYGNPARVERSLAE